MKNLRLVVVLCAIFTIFSSSIEAMAQTTRGFTTYTGAYSSSATYSINDMVLYQGTTYISTIFNNVGNLPSSSSPDWNIIGQEITTILASQMPALTGDCTTTVGTVGTVCLKTNGVPFGSAATTNSTAYDAAGLATSAQTNAEAAFTGDVTKTAGSFATTVTKVNGLAIPVATPILGSNGSGQFVAATSTQVQTLIGSGVYDVSGSATTAQTNAEAAFTGDVIKTAGSFATVVTQVNSAVIPTSASVLSSNASKQIIAATTIGSGSIVLANGSPVAGMYIDGASQAWTALPFKSLTTTGSSGVATLVNGVLNIPQYGGGSGSGTVVTATIYSPVYYSATGTTVSGVVPFTGLGYWSASAPPAAATSTQVQTVIGSSVYDVFGSATTAQTNSEAAFTGDVTKTANSFATTVVKVNGAVVPASQPCVGTNSSSQIIASTCSGSGGIATVTVNNGLTQSITGSVLTLGLGAITPTSVAATGTVSGTSFTGTGTEPPALSLPAGTGNAQALPAFSAGFIAPATGGTSYVYKLPSTATAGVLTVITPSTGADGVNESIMYAIPLVGSDAGILTAGTISTTAGTALCVDTNGGATTTGCTAGSGGGATSVIANNGVTGSITSSVLTLGLGAITPTSVSTTGSANGAATFTYTATAATAPTTNQFQISPAIAITTPWSLSPAAAPATGVMYATNTSGIVQQSFKSLVGTDTSILTAGTVSNAAGVAICVDANGGATTTGCNSITNVGIATANGISGSSTGGLTPSLTIVLGAINPTSIGATAPGLGYFTNASAAHLIGTAAAIPTIVAGTGAGTTPTVVTIQAGSTDLSGYINITSGTTPTAAAAIATVTFHTAYAIVPKCSWWASNAATAALAVAATPFVSPANTTTTLFVLTANATALTASTAYQWGYTCTQ